MATKKKVGLTGDALVTMRKRSGLNQLQFWERFGITQSGGSRYETGRVLPKPAKILLTLYVSGKVTDEDLTAARKAAGIGITVKTV